MEKVSKKRYILLELKYSILFSFGAGGLLSVLGLITAFFRNKPIVESIYMALYYGGAFVLLISVPQLLKRNEDIRIRKTRRLSPLYGFYDVLFENPYTDNEMMKSFEEFKEDGFWAGITLIVLALMLFIFAFIIEQIYFIGR